MASQRDALRSIRTFPQLIKFLRDELEWPIESANFEELTFDYTAEELGIDSANAAKIQEIKRLRPLSTSQPWGIFFVKFEPKRLPVVALRRVLSRVVLKKRASANSTESKAWQANDLLFISNYGEGTERQISFAHFSQDGEKADLPTLKVLGWDNRDTPLHLDDVADTLQQKLSWPGDDKNAKLWREQWSSAFTLRHREVITTSKELAIWLAELARSIRDRIQTVLNIETDKGPLRKLMTAFQQALIHDLTESDFADMYAQTIAYGLLSARIANPKHNTADAVATHIPLTNPFLKELMETFLHLGGRKRKERGGSGIDFDELGVSEVVDLLDAANMEAVVRDFGDLNPEEDPVIHFYELFLSEYDPGKRVERGVFYTPQPVVSFIVRSVHELLQTEFGLEDGLASTATWGEMAAKHAGLSFPAGAKADDPFVVILDPATGTATFLVEVIEVIHVTLTAKWKRQRLTAIQQTAAWNEYVPKYLLPRLHGYELLMAPYAIAHVKIGLKLYETGYRFESGERARVYLTNALDPPSDGAQMTFSEWIPALANEAKAVNAIKRNQHFTVVIGNPPYANYSANLTDSARRIVDKYRAFAGVPIRERNQLQFERNIQDDFVKFIAIGEKQIIGAGVGVLSYITNATMLASRSLRGMREHLGKEFDHLLELNLHGGLNEITVGVGDDENVFEIAQSVAIHVYARSFRRGEMAVGYSDLFGPRSAKYNHLRSHSISNTEWKPIQPDPENYSFRPQDEQADGRGLRLDSAFVKFGAGVKTGRDAVVIGFDDNSLRTALREFDPLLAASKTYRDNARSLLYRPFDIRRIFYHKDLVDSRSLPTMQHVVDCANIGLVGASTWTTPERFSVNISRLMVEMKTGTHDRGTTFFPVYRFERLLGGVPERVHNMTLEFVSEWEATTHTRFTPVGRGDLEETCGPEDVLSWLYGLFYSPEYRSRHRASLSQGFPIIIVPANKRLLRDVIKLGDELIALHLFESPRLERSVTKFFGSSSPEVEKISYSDNTVWLDRAKTYGFAGVPEVVWSFYVGGYPVCEKWLKDRKHRRLSEDDIAHYSKIVVALSETIRLMKKIDEVIDEHGGWPGAFGTREQAAGNKS